MIRRLLAASALVVGVVFASATPASADTWCLAVDPVLGMCQGVPGAFQVIDDLLP
jgi:hypothetical protein